MYVVGGERHRVFEDARKFDPIAELAEKKNEARAEHMVLTCRSIVWRLWSRQLLCCGLTFRFRYFEKQLLDRSRR
jgi:hypothetical protein